MSAAAGDFLDTNVLVYAFSTDPRSSRAEELLAQGCAVGVQGLNEFANVARKKLAMSWDEVEEALATIRTLCPRIVPVDLAVHADALRLAPRYGLSFYDALMVSAALAAGCGTMWSEDMQNGLLVEDRLRIADPFAAEQ